MSACAPINQQDIDKSNTCSRVRTLILQAHVLLAGRDRTSTTPVASANTVTGLSYPAKVFYCWRLVTHARPLNYRVPTIFHL